jgi:hypothetical protein
LCDLSWCTVAGNSALEGGGVYGPTNIYDNVPFASTSIIYHNSALADPNVNTNVSLDSCCSIPVPNPSNNITNEPAFVDIVGGNFRLSSNSPCINFVYNPFPPEPPNDVDLDGNPRAVGGGIDIGAYEFQTPASSISYYWLQKYGLSTDGSADHSDPDGDHFDNWSEWVAHTSPLDATSLLRFSNISVVTNAPDPTPLIHLEWQAVPGVLYFLSGSGSVTGPFTNIANYIEADSTSVIWESAIDPTEKSRFYKVGVE